MKRFYIVLTVALISSLWQNLNAEDINKKLTVEEIIKQANKVAYYQGKDGKAKIEMEIYNKNGKKRIRKFTVLRRDALPKDGKVKADDYCAEQKFYISFTRPADWNRTVFMVHKFINKDDDRWLYLPGLDLVKRISATDKRTSFVGSHFFYEDISGRNLNEDIHELIKESKTSYTIKNTPKKADTVEFSYYLIYVQKGTFLPYASEYFDKNGEKYREGRALKTKVIDGYLTVIEAEMNDSKIGGKTILKYSKVKYNINLPENIFTERFLRNPPRKFLR